MMQSLRLRTVRHKLLLMVLIANLATLISAGGALLYHELTENRAKALAELSILTNILAQGSATALEFDDTKVANENLAQLRANSNIVAAAIYTSQGKLFAHYLREKARKDELPASPGVEASHFEGGKLTVSKHIISDSEVLGTIYLKQQYDLGKWLLDYLVILGLVLFASLALGVLISSQLQRWISVPIHAISTVARQVMEQHNYHLRASKSTEDEIGQLAQSFNDMLQTLEREISEKSQVEQTVRTLNADLERRVTDRTNELQIANQTLITRTDEAESANRAKADFLANMSHEIRTPMNAILGFAYLLEKNQLNDDARDLIKKIRNAGHSLQGIINDILDFSKIEAGQLEVEHAPFRIVDLLDNLAGIMAATVGDKDVELTISPPPAFSGQLLGDALRVEQVLINLTGNAIKFTEHGSVTLDIRQLARDNDTITLRFSVTDTGIGVPLEKQSQIFAAFSQADISTTRRFGGTGLGLTICRHLVHKMGGEIGVISEPGKGSEFWFTVPFDWTPASAYAPSEMTALDILIADDSENARENLALTARSVGWNPTKVDSGEAAIQKVQARLDSNSAYDVLLFDWKMPGIDGLQAASQIRHALKNDTSPIVLMVTAFSRDELLKQADIGLIDGILSKPVTCSTLYNCVAEVLSRRGSSQLQRRRQARISKEKRLPGVRVLVVDDSEINREVAQRILAGDGATVYLANDGYAAVEWLRSHPKAVDIVLMDVQMPIMDGYEATRQLRALPNADKLPVVALTAGAFKMQQEAAHEAGMDAFVAKPFNVEELITVIQKLTHYQSPQSLQSPMPEDENPGEPYAVTTEKYKDSLPGIAVKKAMATWNDFKVYRKFLLKFKIDYAGCTSQFKDCYATNDVQGIKTLAHKLKGCAGNLGLIDIAHVATEIETAGTSEEGQFVIDKLQMAMDKTFTSITLLCANEEKTAEGRITEPDFIDKKKIGPLLRALLHALDADHPDRTTQLFEALKPLLPSDRLDSLLARVDDFDFRGAEILTQNLANDLDIELKE
ncbi:response regulator [Undibacterium sp. Ji50W]|uniref:hybrid sensor histidine kinase/response regulator n=1 Tax=Undibacterium sp. Ji50W TaxID=3413041 RepID=UPI003BF2BFAB